MLVSELISQLQQLPAHLEVKIWAVGYCADIRDAVHDTQGDVERVYVVEHGATDIKEGV